MFFLHQLLMLLGSPGYYVTMLFVCLSIYLSVDPFADLPIGRAICLADGLSDDLLTYLSV